MENQILDTDHSNPTDNLLTQQAIGFLSETRKWAKFLSIVGFIGLGFLVIAALSVGAALSTMGNIPNTPIPLSLISILYFLLAALYFFPVLYLYKFSNYTGSGIKNNSPAELTIGFKNLKSHYKFIGILTILFLSLYPIGIITVIAIAALK